MGKNKYYPESYIEITGEINGTGPSIFQKLY
jgi:hypothetical protein